MAITPPMLNLPMNLTAWCMTPSTNNWSNTLGTKSNVWYISSKCSKTPFGIERLPTSSYQASIFAGFYWQVMSCSGGNWEQSGYLQQVQVLFSLILCDRITIKSVLVVNLSKTLYSRLSTPKIMPDFHLPDQNRAENELAKILPNKPSLSYIPLH